jgi:hypothetical protein
MAKQTSATFATDVPILKIARECDGHHKLIDSAKDVCPIPDTAAVALFDSTMPSLGLEAGQLRPVP